MRRSRRGRAVSRFHRWHFLPSSSQPTYCCYLPHQASSSLNQLVSSCNPVSLTPTSLTSSASLLLLDYLYISNKLAINLTLLLVFFGRLLWTSLHRDWGINISTTFLCIIFWHNIFVVETQSLSIVFSCVKVHLRLDLKHEVSLVATKKLRPKVVFLCI